MLDHLDIYCERTDPSFWSEPVNALTNLAFIISAWLLYKRYKAMSLHDSECRDLIGLVALVGLGSFIFHTYANYAALLADVIPIIMFIWYYLWIALRRLLLWKNLHALVAIILLISVAVQLTMTVPPSFKFNGSITYVPCLIAIWLVGWRLRLLRHAASTAFFQAGGWLAASLIFRSIDMAVCDILPLGTHFLWHILNGVVLYLLARAMLDYKAKNAN